MSLRGLNLQRANASCDLHDQPGIPGGSTSTKQVKFELIDLKCNIVDWGNDLLLEKTLRCLGVAVVKPVIRHRKTLTLSIGWDEGSLLHRD